MQKRKFSNLEALCLVLLDSYPNESFMNIAQIARDTHGYKGNVKYLADALSFHKKNTPGIEAIKAEAKKTESPELLDNKVRNILKTQLTNGNKQAPSLEDLSNELDVAPAKVRESISRLKEAGFNISELSDRILFSKEIPKQAPVIMEVDKMTKGVYRFGVTGDNHLGSKYERLDALKSLYDLFEKEGIQDVYNTGNWIDGEARFNKHDLHTHGLDNQIDYFLRNYPRVNGLKTHFIAGDDHEGWYTQREGIDVGRYAMMKAKDAGRDDLNYLGYMESDVILPAPNGRTILRVVHPGGGSSYAISYTMQKLVESYQEGDKPHIVLAGHYHKQGYNQIRGVHCFQTGCTQDQTPFMRKKKLRAELGGWIIEVHTDKNGAVTRIKSEWIPFYNQKYYKANWSYKFGDERAETLKSA